MMPQPVSGMEISEFWRWLANSASAISLYFISQIVMRLNVHGKRLSNHSQRLSQLDNQIDPHGE